MDPRVLWVRELRFILPCRQLELIWEGLTQDLLELVLIDWLGMHGLGHEVVLAEGWGPKPVISLIDPILVPLAHNHYHLICVVLEELQECRATKPIELKPLPHQIGEFIIEGIN